MQAAFHVMAKPAGALCNMQCAYCFFLSKQETLGSIHTMPDALLETFIRHYIACQPPGPVVFTWQGGEPTLAGIPVFRRIVALQRKHCPPDKTIANDLQTNGQLVDDAWCDFLKEENFLVGLSLDGPESLHDLYRIRSNGRGSFAQALNAARLFHKHGIPFNTLTVLHRRNTKAPLDVYRFLRDEAGSAFMQFLPLVETTGFATTAPGYWPVERLPRIGAPAAFPGSANSFVTEWSVEPGDFGRFLCRVFDEWKEKDLGKITIPIFESMLGVWMGYRASMCVFDAECGNAFALDSDGSVYFCDRFCFPAYRLGKIDETGFETIAASYERRLFGKMKGAVSPGCRGCRWHFACRGECPRNRFLLDERGNVGLNYLCQGLKQFFEHIDPAMKHMADILKRTTGKGGGT